MKRYILISVFLLSCIFCMNDYSYACDLIDLEIYDDIARIGNYYSSIEVEVSEESEVEEVEEWEWTLSAYLESDGQYDDPEYSELYGVGSDTAGYHYVQVEAWNDGAYGFNYCWVAVVEVDEVSTEDEYVCVGEDATFTATTYPSGYGSLVSWSGGGDPASDNGASFTTSWSTPGEKTVTATCGTSSEQESVTVADVTNFHEVSRMELENGQLYFEYEWDSTSGNLADLDGCKVGEKVDYSGGNPYYPPSPPFDVSITNPSILEFDAVNGFLCDSHLPPTFKTPYEAASFTGSQIYRAKSCAGSYTTLMGPISISRYVTGGGPWRYSIIKSGAYAEIFPLP